ncbi:MAG: hypothetical protein JSW71_23050 [Gemmatimonadota bacterium]|nr:MAG: hypothetical protein JSW71_23050 [Gemmatimonadota bacterium]
MPPRSQGYLLTPLVDDARALWINPAGLAVVREASIMAEAVFNQPEDSNIRLIQWSLGFNTRGLSAGYQRDRLVTGTSNQLLRIGLARPFRGGAVGIDLSFYWSDVSDRALGLGITYNPVPSVAASVVLRNIGQPVVAGVKSPFTGVAGLGWTGAEKTLQIAGEVQASDRLGASGFDVSYRAGARIASPRPFPIAAIVAMELGGATDANQFFIGIALGGNRRIVLGGTFLSGSSSGLDVAHITGLATNRQTPIQR